MDPSKINLDSFSKLFEYEKLSREVDQCDDIERLKSITKSYIKLYFAQQEALLSMGFDR
jgi:hypothetical protein